ncbi:MAG: hypothetical protein NTX53_19465 [candidate division WOR-3 bacterium]|nr:hypothetical protein [candidate division WOR-3 bacterium]
MHSPELVQVRTKATSPFSATVMDPVVLKETSTTREVAYGTITQTHGTPSVRGIEVVITHERKGPKSGWEPVDACHLSTLKAGECVKVELHSKEARKLYEALQVWYNVSEKVGVKPGIRRLFVKEVEVALKADSSTLDELVKLLAKVDQPDLLAALRSAGPDITGALSYASLHAERTRALQEFERNLARNQDENYWQRFFESNGNSGDAISNS